MTRHSSVGPTAVLRGVKIMGGMLLLVWVVTATVFLVIAPDRFATVYEGITTMGFWIEALVVAIACGVVGWVTNWIAIQFLFHPREESP